MIVSVLFCIINSEKKRLRCCGRINFIISVERGGLNNVLSSFESRYENYNSYGSWAIFIVANSAARISISVIIIGLVLKRSVIVSSKIFRFC